MTVLVAHFVSLICRGACSFIADSDDFAVCAETDDARRARQLFENYRPRVVIVGPALRGGDGIQLIKELHKIDPKTAILMLSASEEGESVKRAWRAGALGYLRIVDGDKELITALEKICAGERYVSEGLKQRVFKSFGTGEGKSSGLKINRLSDREREVFLQVGKGASNLEIARRSA